MIDTAQDNPTGARMHGRSVQFPHDVIEEAEQLIAGAGGRYHSFAHYVRVAVLAQNAVERERQQRESAA